MLLVAVAAIALLASVQAQTVEERNGIINATLLQSMRQFPHHVTIYAALPSSSSGQYCSGSILAPQWVLTSDSCAIAGAQLTLLFNRLNVNISMPAPTHSYSIVIPSDGNVHRQGRVNLALIHLPKALQFNADVAPIALTSAQQLAERFAVLPGVRQGTLQLAYGEFEILRDATCAAVYSWYNSAEELCTGGWRNSSTVPCAGAVGGGLVIDWPNAPKLVGVFSAPQSCLSYIPAEYVRVGSYLSWIARVIGQQLNVAS